MLSKLCLAPEELQRVWMFFPCSVADRAMRPCSAPLMTSPTPANPAFPIPELSLGSQLSHQPASEPQQRAREGQGALGHEPVRSIWPSDLPKARDVSQIRDCSDRAQGCSLQALPLMPMTLREQCFDCTIFCWYWSATELGEGGHGDCWVLVTRHETPEHGFSGFPGIRNLCGQICNPG